MNTCSSGNNHDQISLLRAEREARSEVLITDKPEYERPPGRPVTLMYEKLTDFSSVFSGFEKLTGFSKAGPSSTRFSLSGRPIL